MIFFCHVCSQNLGMMPRPLCKNCEKLLFYSPRICVFCQKPCNQQCQSISPLTSLKTIFEIHASNQAIFKKWQKTRGILFDRMVFAPFFQAQHLDEIKAYQAKALYFIPPFSPPWHLQPSISEWMAKRLAKVLHLKALCVFEMEQKKDALRVTKHHLTLKKSFPIASPCILVEGIIHSYQTLYTTSSLLKNAGIQKIHGVSLAIFSDCLSIEPLKRLTPETHLKPGASHP